MDIRKKSRTIRLPRTKARTIVRYAGTSLAVQAIAMLVVGIVVLGIYSLHPVFLLARFVVLAWPWFLTGSLAFGALCGSLLVIGNTALGVWLRVRIGASRFGNRQIVAMNLNAWRVVRLRLRILLIAYAPSFLIMAGWSLAGLVIWLSGFS